MLKSKLNHSLRSLHSLQIRRSYFQQSILYHLKLIYFIIVKYYTVCVSVSLATLCLVSKNLRKKSFTNKV